LAPKGKTVPDGNEICLGGRLGIGGGAAKLKSNMARGKKEGGCEHQTLN